MSWGERVVAGVARGVVGLLRALPPGAASTLAGRVARTVGPWLPASRVADVNLRLAMPELDARARRRILLGSWENLGRTAGELPHLATLPEREAEREGGPGWHVEGMQHIEAIRGRPAILIAAHLGNWELMPLSAVRHGLDFGSFYRASENPGVERLIQGMRGSGEGWPKWFPKGGAGAKQGLQHLLKGGYLGMLIDQKMNDGVEARLFGRPAMTSTAAATLSVRTGCPVVPVSVVRLGPARLVVVVEPPMLPPATGARAADVLAMTQAINDRLEGWVRARPETWLWQHRRFDKALYRRPGAPGQVTRPV